MILSGSFILSLTGIAIAGTGTGLGVYYGIGGDEKEDQAKPSAEGSSHDSSEYMNPPLV